MPPSWLGVQYFIIYFFVCLFVCLFVYRGRVGERERNIDVREKHQLVASPMHPRDPTHKAGMCPDLELNQ